MTGKGRLILIAACAVMAAAPTMADDASSLVHNGKFYGDLRYRYEFVDQDGPAPVTEDATASTLRARLGFQTGLYRDFQALAEIDLVKRLGSDDYNDAVNGRTSYPVVADPETVEGNQFWISWQGLPDTKIQAGRQTVNIDNQRFIGSVNWRQNDQTLDAVRIENTSIDKLSLLYLYGWRVNRVFGNDHPQGDWSGEVHAAHATYAAAPWMNVTGYGYWMDFNIAPASSSRTAGLRLNGDVPLGSGWTFFYEAEAARQSDHGNNPANYDETYYLAAPGLKWSGLTLQAGYEVLGGDGTQAFQTPLATLHAFNGWADKFLTTPANGLEDAYARAAYKVESASPWTNGVFAEAAYHDFSAENTSADYGTEWDFQIGRVFKTEEKIYPFKEWSVSVKYADYDAKDLFTDAQKVWLTLGTKF